MLLVVVHTYRDSVDGEVIRIVSARQATRQEGKFMRRLTAERRANLERLAQRPDSEIDLSDIPEIRELPSDAVIGQFYRPKKQSVTLRLDADVLAWLKSSGEGYQTRVNTYLRQLMTKRA